MTIEGGACIQPAQFQGLVADTRLHQAAVKGSVSWLESAKLVCQNKFVSEEWAPLIVTHVNGLGVERTVRITAAVAS